MTHRSILLITLSLCIGVLVSGCMSYTTLQSPKTLEPSQVLVGGGISRPIQEGFSGIMYEFNSRVGIVSSFDVGAKFVVGSLFFIDGKYQILKEPISVSADLGWSYFSYSGIEDSDKGKTTGWYPMLIAGQDHWYIALKRVYFITQGEIELFGTRRFKGSGWTSTNVVAGAIFGTNIRFIPELNLIIPQGNGKAFIVPAIGLQFIL